MRGDGVKNPFTCRCSIILDRVYLHELQRSGRKELQRRSYRNWPSVGRVAHLSCRELAGSDLLISDEFRNLQSLPAIGKDATGKLTVLGRDANGRFLTPRSNRARRFLSRIVVFPF